MARLTSLAREAVSSLIVLGLLSFGACSSENASSGDDDEGDDEGASGGSTSGAAGTSGASTGGATGGTGTGGISGAATGGAGGSGAGSLRVRCFDYGDNQRICYGTPGTDNWAVAWKRCSIEPSKNDPAYEIAGGPAASSCDGLPGLPDDPTGWDEVLCLRHISSGIVLCFGRLGEFWLEIFADCSWADLSYPEFPGDPAQTFCGAPSVQNGGWDELRCFNPGGDAVDRCWGRRGAYWVGPSAIALYLNGLTPACNLDPDGTAVEISRDQVPCPAGTGGTSGSGGAGGTGAAGGSAGVSGTGGSGGSGGAMGGAGGTNPAGCPPTPPPPPGTVACPNSGYRCEYAGTTQCDCTEGTLICSSCPATPPVVGSACIANGPAPGKPFCYYDRLGCSCTGPMTTWLCTQ